MRRQHRMAKYPCRVRKFRKSARLSQRELARLLGLRSQGVLSQIEAGVKRPSLMLAFASAVVLGATIPELYPALFARAERRALVGARELHQAIAKGRKRSDAKAYVAALITRLDDNNAHV
jgi:transcriptional regulator with XRE-family HTH domain